jgi:hypothetical protein
MAVSEEDVLAAAQRVLGLRDARAKEIAEAAKERAEYDAARTEAVAVDEEMTAAVADFVSKANDYKKPDDSIP